jgi:hypothetical protein
MTALILMLTCLISSPFSWADDFPPSLSDSAIEGQAPGCNCQQDSDLGLSRSGITQSFAKSVGMAAGTPSFGGPFSQKDGLMDPQTAKAHMTKIKNLMLRKVRSMACEKPKPMKANSDREDDAPNEFGPPDGKMSDSGRPPEDLESLDPDQMFNAMGGMPRTSDPLIQDDIESMKQDVQEAIDKKLASCERKKQAKMKQQQQAQVQQLQQMLQQLQGLSASMTAQSGAGPMQSAGSFNPLGQLGSASNYQMPITPAGYFGRALNTTQVPSLAIGAYGLSSISTYGLQRWRIMGN